MPSNHLILCCPLILLPSVFPSIKVFSNESHLLSGVQSIGTSVSASVLPMNIQDWFPLGWTGLISLHSKGLWNLFQQYNSKESIIQLSAFFMVQLSHPYMTTGYTDLAGKVMSLLVNMLSRLEIAFLSRNKCLLISWLQSPSENFWSTRKKSLSLFPLFPHLLAMKWWDWMPLSLFFECWILSQIFHTLISLSSKGSLVPLQFLP